MSEIAILEFSPDLAGYFTRHMESIEFHLYPVWRDSKFPIENFDAYIITGDYNNISNGLLSIHHREMEFFKSILDKKIFCSCFSHQLFSMIYGGKVSKREHRFLGWYKIDQEEPHPIFKGLDEPYFLCLNVDEIQAKPEEARVLATHPDCKYQVLQYGDNIITFQSHPEIFKQEGLEAIEKHRESLLDHCSDLDNLVKQTKNYSDDKSNKLFMENLVEWLSY